MGGADTPRRARHPPWLACSQARLKPSKAVPSRLATDRPLTRPAAKTLTIQNGAEKGNYREAVLFNY